MKAIKVDLPSELNQIKIHTFADLHLGDAQCNYDKITEWIKEVEEDEEAYCILNGDLMDTAIISSIGDTYAQTITPMEQCQLVCKLFGKLAEQGKIIGLTGGNHENRIYKQTGIDTTMFVASQFGLLDRYTETTGVIFLRFGETAYKRKNSYSIYFTHGSGGGRKEGGKINRLADYCTIVDADVYICSHTHLPMTFKNSFYRCDYRNNSISRVTKLFVNTASQLNYGGYGDKQGYKPASNDNPVIILDGRRKKMNCIL